MPTQDTPKGKAHKTFHRCKATFVKARHGADCVNAGNHPGGNPWCQASIDTLALQPQKELDKKNTNKTKQIKPPQQLQLQPITTPTTCH